MWLAQSKEGEKEMQQRGNGDPDRVGLGGHCSHRWAMSLSQMRATES